MHKISFQKCSIVDFIVKRQRLIEIIFGVMVILSLFFSLFVEVNYDLTKYLPADAPSKIGIDLMEEQFGYPGTARVMIDDVTLNEAKAYKDRIEAVDGVDMVTWADSTTDVYQGSEFLQLDKIDDYYKEGHAVMDITFEEGDSSKRTSGAIDEIIEIIGPEGHIVGTAVQHKSLSENLGKEMRNVLIFGISLIAFILCLSTISWFEPVLFLAITGIAIIINNGTNIFLGTISFLTKSVSSVLQIACSMDYSIFLLHAFTKRKEAGEEPNQAIRGALEESIKSILPSGATTVAGFIVLALMKFSIGFDMGIVLAKGIVISLITVLFLMPAFIMRTYKLVEKTTHRPFLPSFHRFGMTAYRVRNIVLVIVLIIAVPAYVGQGMNDFLYGNDTIGASPGSKVYEDEQAIDAQFGRSNMLMAIFPNTSITKERLLAEELENLSYTKSVTSLANMMPEGVPESIIPESITGKFHTDKYARMLIYIRTKNESELAFQCADEIKSIVKKYYPDDYYVIGETPSTQDIKAAINSDYSLVNMLSILGVAFVVMLSFKSVLIAILVMIPIEMAIFINMTFPYLIGDSMVFMGYLMVSSLQLGATVDYSILMTNNFLDYRSRTDKKQAVIEAVSASAPSVLSSGIILSGSGYILYNISTIAAIGDLGHLVGRGALLSMFMVLLLLPALLSLFDKPIINYQRKQKERVQHLHDRLKKGAIIGKNKPVENPL